MKKLELDNDMILIVSDDDKKRVLSSVRNKGLVNVKIMTLTELYKKYTFDYDKKAVYYLMSKYNYQYDVAKKYLSYLDKVDDDDFGNGKIRHIINLRDELKKEGLLKFTPNFRKYLISKKIVLYNCKYLSKLQCKFIDKLKKNCSVLIYNEEKVSYKHEFIWKLETINDEVCFACGMIRELLDKGIPLKRIKLCGINDEYILAIRRIFSWFDIPLSYNDNTVYGVKMGQDFLNNLDMSREEILDYIKNNYSLKSPKALDIYNEIIMIMNDYAWANSLLEVKDFLKDDLKKIKVKGDVEYEGIEIVNSLSECLDDDYVFLMGFNQGNIPFCVSDEDYFSDEIKAILNLDTSSDINKMEYDKWLENIRKTKNLVITMKKIGRDGDCYLSSLNDDLNLEIKEGEIKYTYSDLYNKISLAEDLDNLVKYNECSSRVAMLYNHYPKIEYGIFNQNYHRIDKDKLKEYLNKKLVLSYSAMNTYYKCSFRYYLSNILKLNIYEETFYTVLGNLFHYILSICFKKEINIRREYQRYIDNCNYEFNEREKFFLNILESDLEFIIETIKKQNETNNLKKEYFEEKISIDKSRDDMDIVFKGFVDKIMLNDSEDIAAIIDYKTGNPEIDLNYSVYGLELQLPVYVYLVKEKFPNVRIAGFYLQKILNNEINMDNKHTYEYLKEEKLKLQGYSNSDISVLEEFDSNYYDSDTIKGMRTTSKGIASKKIVSDTQIEKLRHLTEEKIDEAVTKIINADFDINPKRVGMDNLGCKYCEYKDICFMTEKNIVNLKEYKNMEFLGGEDDDTDETK